MSDLMLALWVPLFVGVWIQVRPVDSELGVTADDAVDLPC